MIFIYLIHYFISIFSIGVGLYFKRFTLVDYQQNSTLRKKRILVIIFLYLTMFSQTIVLAFKEDIIMEYGYFYSWIMLYSAIFFALAYVYLLGAIEIPKRHPKKKRWK